MFIHGTVLRGEVGMIAFYGMPAGFKNQLAS